MCLNPTSFSVSLTLFSRTRVFYCNLILSCVSYPTCYFKYVHSSASIPVSLRKSFARRKVSSMMKRLNSDAYSLFKCPIPTTSFLRFCKSFLLSSRSLSRFSREFYLIRNPLNYIIRKDIIPSLSIRLHRVDLNGF